MNEGFGEYVVCEVKLKKKKNEMDMILRDIGNEFEFWLCNMI